MPEVPERKADSKPDLHLVPNTSASGTNLAECIGALLEALQDVHTLNAELRQLWLETQWIKSDHQQGVLAVPAKWELMIFQIARGQVSSSLRGYPKVVDAAQNLGEAIKNQLRGQVCD